MRTEREWQVSLVCVVLMALLTPAAWALDVCGQSYVYLNAGEVVEVGPGCTLYGQTVVGNAQLTMNGGIITEGCTNCGDDWLLALEGSTVDIVSGTFGTLLVGNTAQVTIYGSDFVLDGAPLDPSQEQIVSRDPYEYRVLSGVYDDGSTFTISINLDTNAVISLSQPQTAPEIEVTPALLAWDFGDVEIGQSATVLVQIYNYGTADLTVSSVSLAGSADFAITAGPATPIEIAPNTSFGVDFEVTYTASAEGPASAVISIASDDEDEPVVDVTLSGVGIIVDVPPQQQIQETLDYFDASVAEGTLLGYGPGNSPSKRLKALRNMIESASDLINAGAYDQAIDQLESIAKKTDGESKPQDFVVGDPAVELNAMINNLIADLAS
jgi:hypothetical protein